ncbi:hypothetical protein ACPUEN_19165 [Algoriphagus yeomjeoni]|uniref:hypothetical protein n=1 Tax=Algoriphagus yeomjeoni TaxID=291403 RepID=UPI003CE53A91
MKKSITICENKKRGARAFNQVQLLEKLDNSYPEPSASNSATPSGNKTDKTFEVRKNLKDHQKPRIPIAIGTYFPNRK